MIRFNDPISLIPVNPVAPLPLAMFPSKAERILSRYRPIAPKPLPLPPSGSFGTDPSSTCASLDSFASSGKCKRSRKRRIEGSSSAKFHKTPKSDRAQVVSGFSNTAGASSLTQGNSDGAVPRRDPRSGSQVSLPSHGSMVNGMEEAVEVSKLAAVREVSEMSDMRRVNCGGVSGMAAPVYVVRNLVEQQGVPMAADSRVQQLQHMPQLQQQTVSPGYLGNSGGALIEKDVAFMERAAASTVLPDRSPPPGVVACGSVCVKGVGYVGGGFTEMIRGITRLPTVADVQSLMQVRTASTATAVSSPVIPAGANAAMRSSPTRSTSKDLLQRRVPEHPPLPIPSSQSWVSKPPPPVPVASENDCKVVTLSLLPNVPSKLSSPSSEALLQAEPLLLHGSHRLEPSLDLFTHRAEPSVVFSSRCSENLYLATSGGGSGGQSDLSLLRNLRHGKTCEADTPVAPGHPLLMPSPKNFMGGLTVASFGGVNSSPALADGAAVDQVYLEQVYGGSTDPVLLVDDCNQALWFNKAYDRALKSASERSSGKLAPTGPYIDPLGHPTPLVSFAPPFYVKYSRAANATLWGFLKKLVIGQEAELPLKDVKFPSVKDSDPSSQLCLSLGESSESTSPPVCMESIARTGAVACANSSRLTTVTLESITELHMEALAITECAETVEVRLAAGSVPALVTDCTSRVRWVNAAFKQMLGHTEGNAWGGAGGGGGGAATSCGGGGGGAVIKGDPPELTFVCSTEKIPRSASAFSGRVNLEWMKGGKRRSMTVPCDVCRLATSSRSMEAWLWKFDLAVSLSLNSPI